MFDFFGILKGILIQNEVDRSKQLNIQISPSATTGTSTTLIAQQTANRTITLPDASGPLSSPDSVETLTNKTISGSNNTLLNLPGAQIVAGTIPPTALGAVTDSITLDQSGSGSTLEIKAGGVSNTQVAASAAIALTKLAALTANRVLQSDGSGVISASSVTNTTLGFLDATSSIQTQLNSKSTITSALVDNHVIRADGTANIQSSNVIIDDSGNISSINSLALSSTGGLTISGNTITSPATTAVKLSTTDVTQTVFTDRVFTLASSQAGVPGQLILAEDQTFGALTTILQPTAHLTANRIITLPDATTTLVGTDDTQTVTNKTVGDALTLTQISTPANPSATHDKLYTKSDDRLYTLTSGGSEQRLVQASLSVVTKTSTYTALETDDIILCDSTAGAMTISLYSATTPGRRLLLKKISSDSNIVTVQVNGGQTLDGVSPTVQMLLDQYDSVTLFSNGSNWNIESYRLPPTSLYSNSAFSATSVVNSDTWFNVVGNSVSLTPGIWELSASVQYGNNGSNPGYGNKYLYWCAATGNNTSTNPAALSTLTGLTVLGGDTRPVIANSSTDATSMVIFPILTVFTTQANTIFIGTRAVASTIANVRIVPTIAARRIR